MPKETRLAYISDMETTITILETTLEYTFSNRVLPTTALTHPSHLNEVQSAVVGDDYQRLEFLGDALLGMLLAELLFHRYPDWQEGDLSRFRARIAGQDSLAALARDLSIGPLIILGRGEEQSGGRAKDSILADVLEALLAAVYLDGGIGAARTLVERLFEQFMAHHEARHLGQDTKSELQELLSSRGWPPPDYLLVEDSGPPHDRLFRYQVSSGGQELGSGEGKSKKSAQQAAAAQALTRLDSIVPPTS